MASLKDLRDRISSVKATQKITRAMQMVAAAKLRRAQESVAAARPYSQKLTAMMADISANILPGDMPPLMRGTGQDKTHLAVICTSDRGLCGGFNVQIIREARVFLRARLKEGKQLKIISVGKKGTDMLKREFGDYIIAKIDQSQNKTIGFAQARSIADDIIDRYEKNEFDVCTLFYSRFKSVISQIPQAQQLIPAPANDSANADGSGRTAEEQAAERISRNAQEGSVAAAAGVTRGRETERVFYEFEPSVSDVLGDLVLRALATQIFQALLENAAGEMGAKMTAMDNATRNAGDMINKLSITYNRQRQARITTELIEIIAGAEAL